MEKTPRHLNDTNFRRQARAVELLGFTLSDIHGRDVQAQDVTKDRTLTLSECNRRPPPVYKVYITIEVKRSCCVGQIALSPALTRRKLTLLCRGSQFVL